MKSYWLDSSDGQRKAGRFGASAIKAGYHMAINPGLQALAQQEYD
jgi:hypothetical protein